MNKALQFGPHPDADQISAFVEHALPSHEKAWMLEHLSVCQECRTIVALSLPPPSPSVVKPVCRPWWSGWNLVWSSAAAVAAVAIFLITIHHTVIAPSVPPPNQSAGSHPPAPPVEAGPSAATSNPQPQRAPAAEPRRDRTETSGSNPPVSTKQSAGTAIAQRDVSSLPINGRNAAALDSLAQPPASPQPGTPRENFAPAAASGRESGGGLGSGFGSGANASFGVAGNIAGQTATLKTAAPARPAAAPQTPEQANETVAVTSAATPIQTETLQIGDMVIAPPQAEVIPLKHRLPSKLPVLSVAAQGLRMVAIDTRNAVFVSKDGGGHWKAVHPQWPGRAVTAILVYFPMANGVPHVLNRAPVAQAPQASLSTSPDNNLPVLALPRPRTSGASLIGTVTDRTGAIISGASVTTRDPVTHASRTVTTDRTGHYQIEGLTSGTGGSEVQVEVQAPGFKKQTLAEVNIHANSPTVADATLDVGTASASVTVDAEAAPMETTTVNPTADEISTPNPSAGVAASEKQKRRPAGLTQSPALFEITTNDGKRWTSPDGVTWKQR